MNNEKPLVTFGVLSDIQYADCDDFLVKNHATVRHYRNSLNLIRKAVGDWKQMEIKENIDLDFILQLGDLIDAKCKTESHLSPDDSVKRVLNELKEMFSSKAKLLDNNSRHAYLLHVWGNHEFYNFTRTYLANNTRLNTSRYLNQNQNSKNSNYYSIKLTKRVKLICLDLYELSVLGYSDNKQDPIYRMALEQISNVNKNDDWNSGKGMSHSISHFRALNGGLSPIQMMWLKNELSECKLLNMKAIVCGHVPLHHKAAEYQTIAWNGPQIIDLMRSFDNVVVAYLAGHYHRGGYHKDSHNIHHLTFRAILETNPNSNSYATIKIYQDRICILGVGSIPSFTISI